jgi:hypothetical protein
VEDITLDAIRCVIPGDFMTLCFSLSSGDTFTALSDAPWVYSAPCWALVEGNVHGHVLQGCPKLT